MNVSRTRKTLKVFIKVIGQVPGNSVPAGSVLSLWPQNGLPFPGLTRRAHVHSTRINTAG